MLKPPPKAPDISIHDAAKDGNIEAIKQHIAAGTDVNVKREYGFTPFHYAAYEGHKKIVELLIGKGADVNSKDALGLTPLDTANISNLNQIADLFRKHGGKRGKELKAEGK